MVGGYLIYVLIQKLQFQKINFLQNLNTVNNFNLCVILNIFQTGLWKHYQEMNIGDNWELAFDKKTWDEGGENRDWGYLTEPY